MSKTSSQHALGESKRLQHQGIKPSWVNDYDDTVVKWDGRVARCVKCGGELKNLGWLKTHLRECFGIS